MRKMLIGLIASVFVVPAHAISVVSLHNGVLSVIPVTGPVSWAVIAAGVAALGLVIGVRVLRRRSRGERS